MSAALATRFIGASGRPAIRRRISFSDSRSGYVPGWEYYLDYLVASRNGTTMPDFNDYYPSQKAYYLDLAAAVKGKS
jgi:hypothetical protein